MWNPDRYVFVVFLAACLALAGCTNTVVVYVTPAPTSVSSPTPTPVSSVTDDPDADATLTLVDCAIQLRYNDVTVILRHTTADECDGASGTLAFMGSWYAIDPGTATKHKNLICKGNYVSRSVVGTPTEVWDTGGAYFGSEICREWGLSR